ncbi:MAG: excinuclease ABC subunit UvrB [Blastochloris sp.]|nr:excinuclease ABC subunit UvrB [Blastochloris sp.]
MDFKLHSPYDPMGDQPAAIAALTEACLSGKSHQVLLGVTGSGKTFTVANVIAKLNRPTLVISHNKTLAAQLFSEFKLFFPENAVEYFVSYFDYYQPEAYIPRTDTYIEKDSSINEEIERLRLSASSSLMTRRDVIVVSSVSCIYGFANPEDFYTMLLTVKLGETISRELFIGRLVDLQYQRNDIAFERGKFRVRGDVIEVFPSNQSDESVRFEFFGDEIERISRFDPLTGVALSEEKLMTIFPAKQFVTPHEKLRKALGGIRQEMEERIHEFEKHGKMLEAQRIKMRTTYDLEMMEEIGFCSGIENYSRHLGERPPGSRPYTLIDFFPKDFLTIIDESHVTVPQVGGMYAGDRSRKSVLVEHGFRLPSAMDNRPLNFEEFSGLMNQTVYVSATPTKFEVEKAGGVVVEQVIRPTGLIDPIIRIRPLAGQIDELIAESAKRVERGERVLVTTLTKRTAEDLTDYLREAGLKVQYIHSEVDAIERVEILRSLRAGTFDILIGINLLREGLDLPEVSLVAVLDADKEGFLRSETSLIQTAGRAARHINGEVILFADKITGSMQRLMDVTKSRREKQIAHNQANNISPQSVVRGIQESLSTIVKSDRIKNSIVIDGDVAVTIHELQQEMLVASEKLEYEKAALLRDQIRELEGLSGTGSMKQGGKHVVSYRKGKNKKTRPSG